jgi:hypothetical protein
MPIRQLYPRARISHASKERDITLRITQGELPLLVLA